MLRNNTGPIELNHSILEYAMGGMVRRPFAPGSGAAPCQLVPRQRPSLSSPTGQSDRPERTCSLDKLRGTRKLALNVKRRRISLICERVGPARRRAKLFAKACDQVHTPDTST
jgi:hypothetical protein